MALTHSTDVVAGTNATATQYNNLRNDLKDGWVNPQATVSYNAYANQVGVINIAITGIADMQDLLEVGDKVRFKQGGGYLYFVVTAVAASTINVTAGGIYTLANEAITDFYISKFVSPADWPLSRTLQVTLTDAATINIDLNVAKNFRVTLGANRTFTVSNAKIGDIFCVDICGAGYAATWFATVTWTDGVVAPLTGGAKFDTIIFKCFSADNYYGTLAMPNL